MARDKNPKIPHDRKNRYSCTVTRPEFDRPVCITYDGCLIDPEDIDIVDLDVPSLRDEVQRLLDDVDCTLRAELAEWSDYQEAHDWCDRAEGSDCDDPTIF